MRKKSKGSVITDNQISPGNNTSGGRRNSQQREENEEEGEDKPFQKNGRDSNEHS